MDMAVEQKMFCAECRRRWGQQRKLTATQSDQAKATRELVNDVRWKEFRLVILRRDGYACQNHLRIGAVITSRSNPVDHIVPRDVAPNLVWSAENCETLCPNCHNRKSRLEQQGFVINWILKVGRFAVYGSRPDLVERAVAFLRDQKGIHVESCTSVRECFDRARGFGARPIIVPASTPQLTATRARRVK